MKTYLISFLLAPTLMAQGPLTPPGAPAPTMKTLTQVEPRTDLATVPGLPSVTHLITEPGSYYLSSNISSEVLNAVEIRSSGVTLDLNGFNISRPLTADQAGTAILITGTRLTNIVIKNGNIFGGGSLDLNSSGALIVGAKFIDGIRVNTGTVLENCRIQHVHLSGVDRDGIFLGNGTTSVVEHCSVDRAGLGGIRGGEILHCTALNCGGVAIRAAGNVTSSRGESLLGAAVSGEGIFSSGNVTNSIGISATKSGINVGGNAINSSGISSGGTGNGIRAASADNCLGISVGGNGIFATQITNSTGRSNSDSSFADGIRGTNVTSSLGTAVAGNGIRCSDGMVTNSKGTSVSGDGINADIITHSRGENASGTSAFGLRATIANSCTASGGVSIVNRYNMP